MPNYRYRALTAERRDGHTARSRRRRRPKSRHRIEWLGLVLVDNVTLEESARSARSGLQPVQQARRAEDVTIFTRDLALLLHAGARIDDGARTARRRSPMSAGCARSSPRFGSRVARRRELCRGAGAASDAVSADVCGAGAGRRSLGHAGPGAGGAGRGAGAFRGDAPQADGRDAISAVRAGRGGRRACCSSSLFVLPQFASVLQDFGAKSDPVVSASSSIFGLSCAPIRTALLIAAAALIGGSLACCCAGRSARRGIANALARLPGIRQVILQFYRTSAVLPQSRGPARQRRQPDRRRCASWST